MQQFLFGIILELLATALGTLGKQLVSYSARLPAGQRARRLKLTGLAVTTLLGPLVDASAYAFAPQAVVAPLNGLDVVWNTMSAPFTLGERLEWEHIVGSTLVAVGAALTAVLGPHKQEPITSDTLRSYFVRWTFVLYVAAFGGGLVCSIQVLRRLPRGCGDKARAIALGATAGAIAGNMFFTSCALGIVRSSIEDNDWSLWLTPLPYILLAGATSVALANIPFMSRGLQEFEALFMVTLFEGCHIGVACISGAAVLHEMQDMPWWQQPTYWVAVLLIFVGLYAIQRTSVGAIVRGGAAPEVALPEGESRVSVVCPPSTSAADLRSNGLADGLMSNGILADGGLHSFAEPDGSPGACGCRRTPSLWAEATLAGLWARTPDMQARAGSPEKVCRFASHPAVWQGSDSLTQARTLRAASLPDLGAVVPHLVQGQPPTVPETTDSSYISANSAGPVAGPPIGVLPAT